MTDPAPHSSRHFTDARDHWWNEDFVALLAKRFGVSDAARVLDVGTGQGHFARTWAPHLAPGFFLTGVDREPASLAVARERCASFAVARGLSGAFEFAVASAEALPFADDTFDLVMCQTVLMHVPDPGRVLAEMTRVTRPGGVVLAAEPNNFAMFARFAERAPSEAPAALWPVFRYLLCAMRGKAALGLGWNGIGVDLPRLFSALAGVQYAANDKAWALRPPYDSPLEQAALALMRSDFEERVAFWPRDEARRYYVAGGGLAEDFDADYDTALEDQAGELHRVAAATWVELSASQTLIAVGRKPVAGGRA